MNRREFISLLGGAAAAWPLAARAQQPDRMRRLGLLMGFAENDPLSQPWIAAFLQGLSELGWSDSRNLHIDYRWTNADVERIKPFAKELVALKPDVILANSTAVTAALQRETTDIPIVFVPVSDPVGAGFVASLARPGGNITGFINFEDSMGGKWLELLKEVAPAVKRAAIMFNPDTAPGGGGYFLHPFEAAGAALGVKPIVAAVRSLSEIEKVIGDLAREPDGGLVLTPDIFLLVNRMRNDTSCRWSIGSASMPKRAACSAMAPIITTCSADRHPTFASVRVRSRSPDHQYSLSIEQTAELHSQCCHVSPGRPARSLLVPGE
jgi:putative tryptophan/tyrosine transport system substrate-binding protein